MCKANLPSVHGQAFTSLQLFDVVAFNQAGERCQVVSSEVLLSGAIACASGFNRRPGTLVAVVLPIVTAEATQPDVDAGRGAF